jgi:hypothetical protein
MQDAGLGHRGVDRLKLGRERRRVRPRWEHWVDGQDGMGAGACALDGGTVDVAVVYKTLARGHRHDGVHCMRLSAQSR